MARRHSASKRKIQPDPKHGDLIVSKFINCVMRSGKKSIAEKAVYRAMEILDSKIEDNDGLGAFKIALGNVRPRIEVKSRRVGGSTYQVPVEVREERQETLAMRWIISFAKARKEKSMIENLASELMDAFNGKGGAVKKREDTHKMADANKAFAHYRV